MLTLRQAITAKVEELTTRITDIKATAAAAIVPLQAEVQAEEQKLVRFAPWLEMKLDVARSQLDTVVGDYLPSTVTTIYGDMDASLLEKNEGVIDDDLEYTTWVEYRLKGELVHRSAHVRLKKLPAMSIKAGDFLG